MQHVFPTTAIQTCTSVQEWYVSSPLMNVHPESTPSNAMLQAVQPAELVKLNVTSSSLFAGVAQRPALHANGIGQDCLSGDPIFEEERLGLLAHVWVPLQDDLLQRLWPKQHQSHIMQLLLTLALEMLLSQLRRRV